MPAHIEPSPHTRPQSYPWAGAAQYGGAVAGWIVPDTDDVASFADYVQLDTDDLGTFDATYSSSDLTVTIDSGEAYVGGKYVAIDETTDVTLPADDTVTVAVGYPANSADDVTIAIDSDFAEYSAHIPIWEFETDADGVTTADDLRPIGPDAAEGITVYGRDEADDRFIDWEEGDDAYLRTDGDETDIEGDLSLSGAISTGTGAEIGGDTTIGGGAEIGGDTTVDGGATIGGDTTIDGGVTVTGGTTTGTLELEDTGHAIEFPGFNHEGGLFVGEWGNPRDDSDVSVSIGNEDFALSSRSPSVSYNSVPSYVFRPEGRFEIWRDGKVKNFEVTPGGSVNINGSLNVETTGGPVELGGGPGDASFDQDESNVAMRARDVAADYIQRGSNGWPRQIHVTNVEPSTYSNELGTLWIDPP